ncbi:glycosyltransferase [Sphingomonas cavernae]|uniref:Glycosyltransferase family 4 protein n=1 Tax=Sphingomonas cavernae TaxID=2320861 RepID=A0A418WK74_9SPHN|nr:glycosyltransferase [Sphingomonas cavernae]RJF90410.1 glycosyltransferase family 4 protein [Sphingomonas cavernae]
MLRALTLSSLFPDASRPNFGVFVERQTLGLAARDDVELEVIAPIGIPPWPLSHHARYRMFDAIPLAERWKGLTVHRPRFPVIPGGNGFASAALMARAVLPLARRIHAERPFDVVDAQFFFPDGPAAMRIARALGLPFSVKARGADIHYWGVQRGSRREIRRAGASADGLLAVSAALRDDMAALGIPVERSRVHYTGVDLDRFRPGDRALLKAERGIAGPLVLSVGALIARKGQALLLDALTLLPGVTLALAGEGPDRGALEAQAARLGVAGRVRFLGSIAHDALPGWLAAADVMALPSSSEGLANAWVEALACGTPTVISDCGGARELLDRPDAGRIVARESRPIAAAIAELLASPPDPAQVRTTAERFTWEANSDALFAHLSALKR